jgi:predicted AAA+ superfamily ATPase
MGKEKNFNPESNIVRFFGNSPFIKMLDVFIDNLGEEYTKKEIQELAGISKGALFKHWNKLEELNVIKVTKRFGRTKLYTLDKKNPFAKDFLNLEARMIEETAPKKVKAIA